MHLLLFGLHTESKCCSLMFCYFETEHDIMLSINYFKVVVAPASACMCLCVLSPVKNQLQKLKVT